MINSKLGRWCLGVSVLGFLFGAEFAFAKMKVYYAHPLNIYDTKQELIDIEALSQLGFEVVNPNNPQISKEFEKTHDFKIFLNLVRTCDLLAFRAFADGSISSGVGSEIGAAKEKNMVVLELPSAIAKRTLSREQTTEFLSNSGTFRR